MSFGELIEDLASPEEWVSLSGKFSGVQVSNLGRAKSATGSLVKGRVEGRSLLACVLNIKGMKHRLNISKVVAEHFVENPYNLKTYRFLDGNPSNSSKDNIVWYDHTIRSYNDSDPTKAELEEALGKSICLSKLEEEFKCSHSMLRRLARDYGLKLDLKSRVPSLASKCNNTYDESPEHWAPVEVSNGIVLASTRGRFKRSDTKEYLTVSSNGSVRYKVGSKVKTFSAAKAVAQLYIPNPEGFKWLQNVNGDIRDVKPSNLMWVESKVRTWVSQSEIIKDEPVVLESLINFLLDNSFKDTAIKFNIDIRTIKSTLRYHGFPLTKSDLRIKCNEAKSMDLDKEYKQGRLKSIPTIPLGLDEVCLPISEYPDYLITNLGNIISLKNRNNPKILNQYLVGNTKYVYLVSGKVKTKFRVDTLLKNAFG